ncbi:hypothetical protein Scep_002498 [Stephania cephalantha]|uniref:Uncharacterized protein n=1 Tax=Stephania cephalantha TaxID=152367 RepID=A0AAP0LA10_9MAGN
MNPGRNYLIVVLQASDNIFVIEDCPHDWLFPQCAAVEDRDVGNKKAFVPPPLGNVPYSIEVCANHGVPYSIEVCANHGVRVPGDVGTCYLTLHVLCVARHAEMVTVGFLMRCVKSIMWTQS